MRESLVAFVAFIVDAFADRPPNDRGAPAMNAVTSTHAVAKTVLPKLSIRPLPRTLSYIGAITQKCGQRAHARDTAAGED
jgi:hypothetical protein